MRPIHSLIAKLAAAEADALARDFLAPAVRGDTVLVRVAGVVCRFRVPTGPDGWAVFRPTSPAAARRVRPATLAERRAYLDRLPARRLILVQPVGRRWLALPAPRADGGLVPVWLVDGGERFEAVVARWDGARHWFDRPDPIADPAAAAFLRAEFAKETPLDAVRRPGLTADQRAAYAAADTLRRAAERDRAEDRLRAALAHGGAEFRGYAERDGGYRVEYAVDGERFVSVVGKDDLTVRVAGVCLGGGDRAFDLASLVGVLREARGEGPVRVGADNGGMDEEAYWAIHPAE